MLTFVCVVGVVLFAVAVVCHFSNYLSLKGIEAEIKTLADSAIAQAALASVKAEVAKFEATAETDVKKVLAAIKAAL